MPGDVDRVLAVLDRLAAEDAREREAGVPQALRSRAIAPTTGRFLFSIVAPQAACEVLELGGSRGYSTLWLAAAARILGGHVTSIEIDPRKSAAWRANVAEAGLAEWASLLEGDALELVAGLADVFDVVFLDADKEHYFDIAQHSGRVYQRLLGRVPVEYHVFENTTHYDVYRGAQLDRAMELGYGYPMGPLKLGDLVGLDIRLNIAEYLYQELGSPTFRPPQLLKKMVRAGKLGKKSGEGFYRY